MKAPLQLRMGMQPSHGNQYLFSDHYLDNLLPDDPRWADALPEAQDFLPWLQELYAQEEAQLSDYTETQLEDHWFVPILHRLGHVFERQAGVPGLDAGVKRPDYVFFPDDETRQKAAEAQKTADYAANALAVGEVKAWDVSLGKRQRGGGPSFEARNPSWQVDYYVRSTGLDWGMLSNGRLWRLVHKDTSQRLSIYYEVDLVELLTRGDPGAVRYFTFFFRQAAIRPDSQGRVFLQDAVKASSAYAVALGEDLQQNVYQALERLMQGFLDLPANGLGPADLGQIYDNSLYLLYRLLFILYGESRGLLPLQNDRYRTNYSLSHMKDEIARLETMPAPMTTVYWGRLQNLFHIINGDDAELNRYLGVPRYNGGLFDRELHSFLEQKAVGDRALVEAVDLLSRRRTDSRREFVDYRTLGVRDLGSIYEGLLEYQPRCATEPVLAVRDRKGERWVTASEAPKGAKVVDGRDAGQVYLETDRGQRKATGSYYTPQYIVQYIVENTLGQLVEEARARVKERAKKARGKAARANAEQSLVREILDLKVLDPAMGSGHFLVEATEFLALALATDPYVESEARMEEDLTHWKRRVVERCIYGVDKNPLAVELAKLSLWLATVAADKPLSFLDHHLRCGDSLIGARVADLGWAPPAVLTKKAQKQLEQQKAGQMNMFEYTLSQRLPAVMGRILEIIEVETDEYDTVQAKEAADMAVQELKAPFQAVADLWVSAYFGHQFTPGGYDQALQSIGQPGELLALPAVHQAREMGRERRFFHWELAFPEVFYDRNGQPLGDAAGFDAVVGNPPYLNAWLMTLEDPESRSAIQNMISKPTTLEGHWDLYAAFIVRSLQIIRQGGGHSFIVPDALFREKYASTLRKYLLSHKSIERVLHFEDTNVFDEVSRHCVVYVVRSQLPQTEALTGIDAPSPDDASLVLAVGELAQKEWLETKGAQIRTELASPIIRQIRGKVLSNSIRVGQFAYVMVGATTHSRDGRSFKKADIVSPTPVGNAKRFLDGKALARYEMSWDGRHIDYRQQEMYGPRFAELFESEKVIVRKRTVENERLVACYDNSGFYGDDTLVLITYYENLEGTGAESSFEGFERAKAPYPSLLFLAALLNSNVLTYIFRVQFATGTLQGSYSDVYPQQVRDFPIRHICFTTPAEGRARLVEVGITEATEWIKVTEGASDSSVSFSVFSDSKLGRWLDARLAAEPEQADVIHDLLAHLAEQMIELNKRKQAVVEAFWLDLEGVTDAGTFAALRHKGKQERTLWNRTEACRPFVGQESHATRRLNESLAWSEDAFKAFVRLLARKVQDLSDLVSVYRKHSPTYRQLVARIASTDRLIDLIVYRLYGLTEEEIGIVEEGTR